MRRFNVIVNDTSYDVGVEEIMTGQLTSNSQPSAPLHEVKATTKSITKANTKTNAPAKTKAVKQTQTSLNESSSGVNAPMPGTVLDIKVSEGDQVVAGQVLLILEAMKMENEIMATASGTIVSIPVSKGASVNSGDLLIGMNE